MPDATARELVRLKRRQSRDNTTGCDINGRGRVAVGLIAGNDRKNALVYDRFPASGRWHPGWHCIEGSVDGCLTAKGSSTNLENGVYAAYTPSLMTQATTYWLCRIYWVDIGDTAGYGSENKDKQRT